MAEAHVAELGDGPAEAVVVDGLRSYYRFDIVRGRVRRDDAAVAEEVYGRVGEELLRVRRRVGVVEPPDAAAAAFSVATPTGAAGVGPLLSSSVAFFLFAVSTPAGIHGSFYKLETHDY